MHPENAVSEARRSLSAGVVPTRLLYESPGQARTWRELAASHSPASDRSDGTQTYSEIHSLVASMASEGPIQVVGLGCGDGWKEADLAGRLARNGIVSSVPVDVSLPLVQVASSRISAASGFPVERPLIIDLESPGPGPGGLIDEPEGVRRVVTLYGALPWMREERVREILQPLLRPGDFVCVSANLGLGEEGASEAVLAQYDNAATRAWIGLLLERLGIGSSGSDLRFELRPEDTETSGQTIFGLLDSGQGLSLELDGTEVAIGPDLELELFRSTRHAPEDLASFCDRAGLRLERLAVSPSGQEGVALALLEEE